MSRYAPAAETTVLTMPGDSLYGRGLRAAERVCEMPETPVTPDNVTAGEGDRVPAGILFGDLKGSTAEAEHDEPSTVAKLREYLGIVNDAAKRFGPNFYKVKSEGDGFMATFATAHC